jgi:hypothetical protein
VALMTVHDSAGMARGEGGVLRYGVQNSQAIQTRHLQIEQDHHTRRVLPQACQRRLAIWRVEDGVASSSSRQRSVSRMASSSSTTSTEMPIEFRLPMERRGRHWRIRVPLTRK